MYNYQIDGDWLAYLYDEMNADFERFHENNTQFITFNYDRSLEAFFFEALKNSYGQSAEKVARIVNRIKIIHLHGQLGFLPWQNKEKEKTRAYIPRWKNDDDMIRDLRIAASEIKIIHEANRNSSEFFEARSILKNAGSILFLGFGYSDKNVERLEIQIDNKNIWGSCLGLTEAEINGINSKLFKSRLQFMPNMDCLGFLRNLSRSIFRE